MPDVYPETPVELPAAPATQPPPVDDLEAEGRHYQAKIQAARSDGLSWEQIQANQRADWQEATKAGLSDQQIARGMGYNTSDAHDRQVIARLRVQAVASPAEKTGIDWIAAAGKAWLDKEQEDVHAEQAGAIAGMNYKGQFHEDRTPLDTLWNATEAVNAPLQNIGGVVGLISAPVTGALDTILGGPVESLTKGNLNLPRQFMSNAVMNIAPFGLHGMIPPAVRQEYIASNLSPQAFLERQEALKQEGLSGPKATLEQRAALEKAFPSPEDRVDAAISVAGPGASQAVVARVQRGLDEHWKDTGELHGDAALRAERDPHFRQQLLTGALEKPTVPAGSAKSRLLNGGSQFVIPKQDIPISDPWTTAADRSSLLPSEAGEAVDQWTAGAPAGELDRAFSANPSAADVVIRNQLRKAAAPIREALRRTYGSVLSLYRVAGPTGNITSFTADLATATKLAGGDPEKVISERVPISDVAWATNKSGLKEILVHTGDQGKPWSLSPQAPAADTLVHTDAIRETAERVNKPPVLPKVKQHAVKAAKTVEDGLQTGTSQPDQDSSVSPKPVEKAVPLGPSTDPRVTLAAARGDPQGWIEGHLGPNWSVRITGGARTPAHNASIPGASPTSEHLSNAAWDFAPTYGARWGQATPRQLEHAGITLARNLREKGVPFDQVEITPTHVHIGFKPDGIGNRNEIIYEGMKPGADAHGVALSGSPTARTEGSITPPEEAKGSTAIAEEEPQPSGLLSTFVKEESGAGKDPNEGLYGNPAEHTSVSDYIASRMGEADKKVGWFDSLKDSAVSAYRDILEPNHAVMELTRLAQEGGMMPDESRMGIWLQRMVEAAPDKGRYNIDEKMTDLDGRIIGPGLLDILSPFKNERGTNTFKTYLFAQQAIAAALRKQEHPVDPITAGDFVASMNEKRPAYLAAFSKLVDFQNQTLNLLSDPRVGLYSQAQVDKWITEHPDYIPGFRVMEGKSAAAGGARRGTQAYQPIKAATGSDLAVQDIYQSIIKQTLQRRILAAQAMAGNEIGRLAQDMGILEAGGARKLVKITMTPEEMDKFKIGDEEDVTLARLFNTDLRDGEFPVFDNGKMTKLSTPRGLTPDEQKLSIGLVKALRQSNPSTLGLVKNLFKGPASLLRAAVSLPPSFSLRIAELDAFYQAMTNPAIKHGINENIVRVLGDGLVNVIGQTKLWDEARRVGSISEAIGRVTQQKYIKDRVELKDPSMAQGVWNIVRSPYDLLRNIRALGTQVIPTGIYAAAKRAEAKSGVPMNAAEVGYTMSEGIFHRPNYGGALGKDINAVVPFFLAHAKMLETTYRNLVRDPKPGMSLAPMRVVYGWGALMTAMTLGNWALNKDQEWYKAMPDWKKDKLLLWHVGPDWEKSGEQDANGNDVWIPHGYTIPIWEWTPGMSMIFSAIPRRFAEATIQQDPHAWDGMAQSIASSLTPPGAVAGATAFQPLVENFMNKSAFTGRPLVPDSLLHGPGARTTPEQLTPYTSGFAHALAVGIGHVPILSAAGPSPIAIDNAVRDWTGNEGVVTLRVADQVAQTAGLERRSKLPTMTAGQAIEQLLGSSFEQYQPGANSQQMVAFWNGQDKVEQIHGDMVQAMKDDDFARFSKLVDANPVYAALGRETFRNEAQPKDPDQFYAKLDEAYDKLDADKFSAYEDAVTAAKNELKVLKTIESLPIDDKAAKTGAADAQDAVSLTNNDKRQLMIAYGTTAAILAEAATKTGEAVGVK